MNLIKLLLDTLLWPVVIVALCIFLYLRFNRQIQKPFSNLTRWIRKAETEKIDEDNARIAEALVGSLADKNMTVISNELKSIVALGESAVKPLIRSLKHPYAQVRWIAVKALGEINVPDALDALVKASGDVDSRVRLTVVTILGNINDVRVTEPLVAALSDRDRLVCLAALQPFALGKVKHSLAVDPLIKFANDKEKSVKMDAINALGKIGDSRAVPYLLELLQDADETVLQQLVWALRDIKDSRAIPALAPFLSHQDPYMRSEVARAMAKMDDRSAVPAIKAAMENETNEDVKLIFSLAIRELTGHDA